MKLPIAIIGAGLSGLCCARRLTELNIPYKIFESSDDVGGRVRTDLVDGFRLDRGFQIYLTAYPEGRRILDYNALNLKPFSRGAMIRFGGKFHTVVDPRAEFFTAVMSVFGPIGTAGDKIRLATFAKEMMQGDLSLIERMPNQPTVDFLRDTGRFTPSMIERFFKPFLSGVFLEPNLDTSSRFFRYVFRMFATGVGAVPALGMQEIPKQIAQKLNPDSVQLHSSVVAISPGEITLKTNQQRIQVRGVVVATEQPAANILLADHNRTSETTTAGRETTTVYFAANRSPVNKPMLVLNGDSPGIINNLVVMSDCAKEYSPAGQSLISVTLRESIAGGLSDEEIEVKVRQQAVEWYQEAKEWQRLKVYRIKYALPKMECNDLTQWQRPVRIRPGLYVCGDHRDQGSINGAMESGYRTAQTIADDLNEKLF